MDKSEIQIQQAIVHILDAGVGEPVFSNQPLFIGSEFSDFLKEHVFKVMTSDDGKLCHFYEAESQVMPLLASLSRENFVAISLDIAGILFQIMRENADIPAADLVLVAFTLRNEDYLGILKMNYKTGFTHKPMPAGDGKDAVDIVPFRALLPTSGQKLTEAAIIKIDNMEITLIEKKYNINGAKINYFSKLFLGCSSSLSPKSRLAIVNRTIEEVRDDFIPDADSMKAAEDRMEVKKVIYRELEKDGQIDVPAVIEKVFESSPQMAASAQERVEKYNIDKTPIVPKSGRVAKKYATQVVSTDTGVELKIPMDQYEDVNSIEIVREGDGRMTIMIKNIGSITAK